MNWTGSRHITDFKNHEEVFLVPRAIKLGTPATLKNLHLISTSLGRKLFRAHYDCQAYIRQV